LNFAPQHTGVTEADAWNAWNRAWLIVVRLDPISFCRNSFGRKPVWLKNDRSRYQNSIFDRKGPSGGSFFNVIALSVGFFNVMALFERDGPPDRYLSFYNLYILHFTHF
jgi:hypothetical protein